jgi:hypothetical protein
LLAYIEAMGKEKAANFKPAKDPVTASKAETSK